MAMVELRKSVRLEEYDYSWAGYYFVTMVSHQRKNVFGEIKKENVYLGKVGEIVEICWNEIPAHFPYVDIDIHIVMPNHFHGIIFINDHVGARHEVSRLRRQAEPLPNNMDAHRQPLGVIVRSFKSAVTKHVHDLGLLVGEKIWQRNYYERVIRDEMDYQKIYEYIESNPINWSLDEENID